jgi:wobble nucleotide-excising tRNase
MKYGSRIMDLALDSIIQNPTSELWVFTDSELEQFARSIISESCLYCDRNLITTNVIEIRGQE